VQRRRKFGVAVALYRWQACLTLMANGTGMLYDGWKQVWKLDLQRKAQHPFGAEYAVTDKVACT
jgi:hypothetical protein